MSLKSDKVNPGWAQFNDGFEIIDFIGKGTFAKVHRCRERKTGQEFAVKIFQTDDETFRQQEAKNEVEIWKALRHRNIVALYATYHWKSDYFVVLELLDGRTLFHEILNQNVYTEEESSDIIQQVYTRDFY